VNYLKEMYSDLTEFQQEKKLQSILFRLSNLPEFLTLDILYDMAATLKEDGWDMIDILAHFDMLDYDERT
jgi:hypothetical protein